LVIRRVRWQPSALRDLRALPIQVARRIGGSIDRYAETGAGDVRKLEGVQGLYRLRVGDYRVIFEFEDGQLVVVVLRIRNRRDVYRG
jgi:mRNA interferase RelE/StbE